MEKQEMQDIADNLSNAVKKIIKGNNVESLKHIKSIAGRKAVENIIKEIKEYGFTVSESKQVLEWVKERIDSETVVKD